MTTEDPARRSNDPVAELFGLLFQAHPWHGVDPGPADGALSVYIEIVPSDEVKYELDKPSGHLRVDRPQRFSSAPPTLYGLIPRTYCGDEVARLTAERTGRTELRGDRDPLDVCVLAEKRPAHGGFLLKARAIGGLRMIDGDEADDKIIAVLEDDLAYGRIREIGQLEPRVLERLKHYFLTYKQLPDSGPRKVEIPEIYGREEAIRVIRATFADYRAEYGAPEERMARLWRLLREG